MSQTRVRSAITSLPSYKPGKAASAIEAEHGITGAIKLSSNENPYPPVPEVVQAMHDACLGVNRYCSYLADDLRTGIADFVGTSQNHIAVGCGSVGLLQQLCLTYLEAGRNAVYPWRSFEAYPIQVTLTGADSIRVPLVDFRFDLQATAEAVTSDTAMVLLATPNNPTGTACSVEQLDEFCKRVPSDVLIMIDEAYREFLDPSYGDPVDLLENHKNVVVSRTFSKAYGLAGTRVGYLVADPAVIDEVNKAMIPFAVNSIAQAGALAAIKHRDAYEPHLQVLRSERKRVADALAEAGYVTPDSQANFVYLPTEDRTAELCLEMEKRGVVTRPFAGEGLRVSIGTPEENDRFLAVWAEVNA